MRNNGHAYALVGLNSVNRWIIAGGGALEVQAEEVGAWIRLGLSKVYSLTDASAKRRCLLTAAL